MPRRVGPRDTMPVSRFARQIHWLLILLTGAVLAFLYLPIYGLWRLGIEVLALVAIRDKAWVRTARHA